MRVKCWFQNGDLWLHSLPCSQHRHHHSNFSIPLSFFGRGQPLTQRNREIAVGCVVGVWAHTLGKFRYWSHRVVGLNGPRSGWEWMKQSGWRTKRMWVHLSFSLRWWAKMANLPTFRNFLITLTKMEQIHPHFTSVNKFTDCSSRLHPLRWCFAHVFLFLFTCFLKNYDLLHPHICKPWL